MLKVRNLETFLGAAQILFDVNLDVARGEVITLVGRNGAGKSTTLKSMMGVTPARRGRIEFLGQDIRTLAPHDICRLGLGYVPEDRRIFSGLTVAENLETGRRAPRHDAPVWTLERLFSLFPNLAQMRDRRGNEMSGGEQQMLAIARTLMGNPLLVLLDEPSEGLAPVIVDQLARVIHELKREGLTIILSEQNLRFARDINDRVYVIERGHIRFTGTMMQLDAAQEVRNNYLAVA